MQANASRLFHLFFNLSNVNIGLKRIYLSTQSDRFKTGKEKKREVESQKVRAKMCVKIIKGLISCITCLNECLCACFCEWRVFKHKIQQKKC